MNFFWQNSNIELNQIGYRPPLYWTLDPSINILDEIFVFSTLCAGVLEKHLLSTAISNMPVYIQHLPVKSHSCLCPPSSHSPPNPLRSPNSLPSSTSDPDYSGGPRTNISGIQDLGTTCTLSLWTKCMSQ